MKHGVDFPPFEEFADPRFMAELAYEAEQAGWDGVFTWDHVWLGMSEPFVDPWVALSAIAARTERIRIGAMVTPLSRRRPWQVARTTVSIDHLSNGRLIFGAGLGSPADTEFAAFGEETDNKLRARKLDEGLDVLAGLWSGEPFSYEGEEYRIDDVTFQPTPVQAASHSRVGGRSMAEPSALPQGGPVGRRDPHRQRRQDAHYTGCPQGDGRPHQSAPNDRRAVRHGCRSRECDGRSVGDSGPRRGPGGRGPDLGDIQLRVLGR